MSSSSQLSFANQDLRNCSFRQQYLRDADFSGADIRGCDFSNANLIGANFGHIRAGLSHKQIVTLAICTVGFAVAYADALGFCSHWQLCHGSGHSPCDLRISGVGITICL
ncbi:MAG: pentapeptide repeat-containing protein [Pseudanabaena sp. RU_4_16]|nr:pentapeptide repeat-containing protein [Pseudanabaena sp. RU_4_16]